MNEILVGKVNEFTDENVRKIVTVGNQEIGVFQSNGQFYAFENVCPHAGGPVCEGVIRGKVEAVLNDEKDFVIHHINEEKRQLVCPWHGWEYSLETGECVTDNKYKVKKYQVIEKHGELYLQFVEAMAIPYSS